MNQIMYVANWKMYLTYHESLQWLRDNKPELAQLSKDNTLVMCPDFTVLADAQQQNPELTLGAQNCASELQGALTGEVSAESLGQLGVTYCIIGHSEQRARGHDTTELYLKKLTCLNACNITPIFCIGEKHEERNRIYEVLEHQLTPVFQNNKKLIIAYEPVWAIGTGAVPTNSDLEPVLQWIKLKTKNQYPLLYGGSVTRNTISELKKLENLDGFLIGKASTDFQELKKIVLSI